MIILLGLRGSHYDHSLGMCRSSIVLWCVLFGRNSNFPFDVCISKPV